MRKFAPILLAAILALGVGFVAVWLLVPAETVRVPVRPPATEPNNTYTTARQDEPAASREPVAAAAPSQERHVATPNPSGGVIRGVARFEDGAPCPGLNLLAEPKIYGLWGEGAVFSRLPREDRNARLREILDELTTESLSATTGEDGRFVMRGAGDGEYNIYSNDRARPLVERPYTAEAGDELEVVVIRAVLLELEVSLSTGEVPTFAGVGVTAGDYENNTGWRPGTLVEARPGAVHLEVNHTSGGLRYRGEAEIDVPRNGLDEPVQVVLEPLLEDGLVVKVNRPQTYYSGLKFLVLPAEKAEGGWPRRVWELTEEGYDTSPWRGSGIGVHTVDPGSYVVVGVLHPVEIILRREVYYSGGRQEVVFNIPELMREDHVVIHVKDAGGRPVGNANVRFTAEGHTLRNDAPGVNMGGGEYWFKRIPPYLFGTNYYRDSDNYIVVAEHAAHGKRFVKVPVDSREDVVVQFGSEMKFVVHLDNLQGDLSDYKLTAMQPGESAESRFHVRPPPREHRTQLRNEFTLPSGPVVVTLLAKGPVRDSHGVTLFHEEINLTDDGQQLRISVPELSDMRLVAPEGYPRQWTQLFGDSIRLSTAPQLMPDDDGRIVFRNLPPGEYIIRGPRGQMTVRMPQNGEQLIEGKPFNGWRLQRPDPNNMMETFGLKRGDIIREINGEPVAPEGVNGFSVHLNQHVGDGDLELKVQRDGVWITLTTTADTWRSLGRYYFDAVHVEE